MKLIYLAFVGIILFIVNILLVKLAHISQKTALRVYIVAVVLIFAGIAGSVLL